MADVLSLLTPLLAAAALVAGAWWVVGRAVGRGAEGRPTRAVQLLAVVPVLALATLAATGLVLSSVGVDALADVVRGIAEAVPAALWGVLVVLWIVGHGGALLAALRRAGGAPGLAAIGSAMTAVADAIALAMLWVFAARAMLEDGARLV